MRPRLSARGLACAIAAGALAGGAALPAAGGADRAEGRTTLERTILDTDRDNRLQLAPGERYEVRQDLGPALPGRARRRAQRIFFGQLTDLHQVDEESPLRVEFLDKLVDPFTSAYRPQEGISPQVLEEMVSQVRSARSPLTGRRLELVMTTGDNSDNTQRNETRSFIDILDGGLRVDPNSGVPGTCGTGGGGRYDGVRDEGEYYEPDSSRPSPGNDAEDGAGYSPDEGENRREAGRSNQVRDFPGLFEDMNRPFAATGLRVPWYGIFGNHDSLVQGNQPRNPGFDALATGCVKVTRLPAATLADVQALAAGGLTPTESGEAQRAIDEGVRQTVADPDAAVAQGRAVIVPRDPDRRLLRKSEYILEHFGTRGTPVGHGFTARNVAEGEGNYAIRPRPGVRFLVLDSVADTGGSDGNIDDLQFRWIHAQLRAAEARKELVMLFAHHSLRTMNQSPVSGFTPGDQGGSYSPLVHFGESAPGSDRSTPCAIQDPATPPTPDETLRCLLLRHRSAVAFVNGHEHRNRVTPYERRSGTGPVEGGFWEINTASHIDWAQQSRLVDLFDNRDGSLSLFGTVIDHAAPPDPGGGDLVGPSSSTPSALASISRELAFNDPDADNGEDGRGDRRGARRDRNVELLVRHPYGRGGRDGDARDQDRDEGEARGDEGEDD